MNKYAALCAIGAVNACHFQHKPLFGMLEPAKHCPTTDVPRLNHTQADRLLLKNIYTGFLKGWYQENHDAVSDQCFGEWMEPKFLGIHELKQKLHEDFWSVSVHDVKQVGGDVIDAIYKNFDECNF